MIELYVSTNVTYKASEITKMLEDNNVECIVIDHCCSWKDENKINIENGFLIKIYNMNSNLFKNKVWKVLQPALQLTCAFVRDTDKFTGCILDWP